MLLFVLFSILLCVQDNAKERIFCFAYFGAPNSFCGANLIKDFVVALSLFLQLYLALSLLLAKTLRICFNNFN